MGHPRRMPLANYLKMTKRQTSSALLALGWSFRRIERETGVRRETISRYARPADPNPAKVFPGSGTAESPDSQSLEGVDGKCGQSDRRLGFKSGQSVPRLGCRRGRPRRATDDVIAEKLAAGSDGSADLAGPGRGASATATATSR